MGQLKLLKSKILALKRITSIRSGSYFRYATKFKTEDLPITPRTTNRINFSQALDKVISQVFNPNRCFLNSSSL